MALLAELFKFMFDTGHRTARESDSDQRSQMQKLLTESSPRRSDSEIEALIGDERNEEAVEQQKIALRQAITQNLDELAVLLQELDALEGLSRNQPIVKEVQQAQRFEQQEEQRDMRALDELARAAREEHLLQTVTRQVEALENSLAQLLQKKSELAEQEKKDRAKGAENEKLQKDAAQEKATEDAIAEIHRQEAQLEAQAKKEEQKLAQELANFDKDEGYSDGGGI